METRKISAKTNFQEAVRLAASELKKGNLVVVPTETSYGLACLAGNKKAVKKIARIKKQPGKKPVSIIVPSLAVAEKYGHISLAAKKLVQKFMPGPLTLVVPSKKTAFHLGGKTIAFRISSNKFVHMLCKKLGDAVTATSANLHGEPDTYSGKKAFEIFGGKVALVVDFGILPKRKPSTIYEVEKLTVLRAGKITEKQIKKALEEK